VAGCYSWGQPG
jgi:hypothetical protein